LLALLAIAPRGFAQAADWLDEMPTTGRVAQIVQQEFGPVDKRQHEAAVDVAATLILLRQIMVWQAATEQPLSAARQNRLEELSAEYERAELAIGEGLGKRRGDLTPAAAEAFYESHAHEPCSPDECYAYWFRMELERWGAFNYRQRLLPLLFPCDRALAFMKLVGEHSMSAPLLPDTPALSHKLSNTANHAVSNAASCGVSGLDVDGDRDCFDWESNLLRLQSDGVRIEPSCAPLVLNGATTEDAESITVRYTIGPNYGKQPVRLTACRSTNIAITSCTDPQAQLIGVETFADPQRLSAGPHKEKILKGRVLKPDTARPYVVVIGDSLGHTSQTWFRKRLVGVLVHGYAFNRRVAAMQFVSRTKDFNDDTLLDWIARNTLLDNESAVEWESDVEASLESVSCYDAATFPYGWQYDSIIELKSIVIYHGIDLYRRVVALVQQLKEQHPDDVVDLHFIGHSRGAVVTGALLNYWVNHPDPVLTGAYVRVTLLDPHPADNKLSPQEDMIQAACDLLFLANDTFHNYCFDTYKKTQSQLHDPIVTLPPGIGIRSVDVWYQQTPAIDVVRSDVLTWDVTATMGDGLCPINLWGKSKVFPTVFNLSGAPLKEHNLTRRKLRDGTVVGHSVVPFYFKELIDKAPIHSCTLPPG
jgi:hypothetical protein